MANIVETELVAAHQTLTAEMQRLLKNAPKKIDTVPAVGGIPVDSEYIIFVIDTSGSMQADNWENAQNVMKEILDIYPKVKGMQILDDEGQADVPEHQGPVAAGHAGAARARSSRPWSTGSRTATRARSKASARPCRAGGPPTRKSACMSSATTSPAASIEAALAAVRKYNPLDRQGRHRIRIHAIGMPDGPSSPPFINSRFAALMRAMCDDNEGTFVGLTIGGPSCAIKIDVLGQPRCIS